MSHIPTTHLHGYANRGIALAITVTTEAEATDLSSVTFRIGSVLEVEDLTPVDIEVDEETPHVGVVIEFTIPAADMDVPAGVYRWECLATLDSQPRTLAQGRFTVDPEPTVEVEES